MKQVYFYFTPQDLPGGQENPAGAPGHSDPGTAEDCCHQPGGARQAPGCQRSDPDPAHDGKLPEAAGGHLPEDDRAGPGHRQLNKPSF